MEMENNDQTKEFYNEMAEKMAKEWYHNNILNPSLIEFIELFSNKNPKILDLGCGTGHESFRLTKLGADVVGVDFSEENIRLAKELFKEGKFQLMDFRNIDPTIGMFDGIFACAALIHIKKHELQDVLRQLGSILNDDGYLGIIIREGTGLDESWSKLKLNDKDFIRPFYLHEKKGIDHILIGEQITFIKEGYLADDFSKDGWRFFIYHKRNSTD